MKKLLLASVAISGLAFVAAPANAEVELELGGYFKGYGAFVDQDEDTGVDVNTFDIVRDTELHVGGETTLDNGLTVGAHVELDVDGSDTSTNVDESYAYFSGNWGRVNFGNEDGAAYLLQVAAPSADSNLDGVRQTIQPLSTANFANMTVTGTLDYDHATATNTDKLTYLSPVFSGFQVGLSMAPDTDNADDIEGVGADNAGNISETYEAAVRYEGQFQQVGVIAGAGYSLGKDDTTVAANDDREAWNVGLDLNIGAFGVGAAYKLDNNALDNDNAETETMVVGADYTTGPFKVGVSYLNEQTDTTADFDRYAGGVTYEYGPGMSFRGSLSHVEAESNTSTADGQGTAL